MMKQSKLLSALSLSFAGMMMASPASAELQVGAGAANLYLYRGADVSEGSARVYGNLGYQFDNGFHLGIAGSSYSKESQEYELGIGYQFDLNDFTFDVGAVNYVYPGVNTADSLGDESEFYVSAQYKGLTAAYFKNIAGLDSGYHYFSVSYQYEKFGALVGTVNQQENAVVDQNYTHLDLSYAVNDRLNFKLSKIISVDEKAGIDDDMLFELSLQLPIEM